MLLRMTRFKKKKKTYRKDVLKLWVKYDSK